MSVEIPVVALAFGSVTPPQGDVLELRVHLGCTKEVSSFECLLQNFDKKYTVTNPVNVGDNCSISIGRGADCPLVLTGRVEEIEPESTPVDNYIRVRGRCWGEKIFRRVVTKTYENQKGEAIVKDLLDNYVGLSHVRDSTELVENTDTTYTLLEYKDTPVFDILKYIAESADKSGVIGFDFRVEWDGKFAFFPKNSKTSPISLSEKIEHSRYSKDIHRVRNKIMVYGAAEKPYPLDTDGQPWSDSLTEDLTKPDNYLQHDDGKWEPVTGNTNLYIETSTVHTGSKSVKLECTAYMYYMGIMFTFDSGKYVNCNLYPRLCFTLQEDSNHNKKITVSLEDKGGNTCRQTLDVADYDEWQTYELGVGKQNQEAWTMSVSNSGPFDWENLKKVRFDFHQLSSKYGVAFIDRMHFGGCRWNATEEDSGSQTSYGRRELVEVDEELHSDNECSLRGKALLDHLGQPAEFLTLRTTCLDYSTDRLMPGDKIHVALPNENIDSDFRTISVEYRVSARDQTLEITLELGKEKPLLADYLYGLRSTTITVEKLMRTKAGLTGGGFVGGGGGGGGGGMVQHGNEWHDPDFLELAGGTLTGDLTLQTQLITDTIIEKTLNAGVTIEGVLCKENQILGGTGSGDNLTLKSTSHATKGSIFFENFKFEQTASSILDLKRADGGNIVFRVYNELQTGTFLPLGTVFYMQTRGTGNQHFYFRAYDPGGVRQVCAQLSNYVYGSYDGEFLIPRAGDITGLAGKTLDFPTAYIDSLRIDVALDLDNIDITGSVSGSQDRVIPVTIAGTTYYIPAYTAYT